MGMKFIDTVNSLYTTVPDKLHYLREHIRKDTLEDVSFLIRTPEMQKFVSFISHKGRENIKNFTEEEYFAITDLVYILQSIYNYSQAETGVSDEDYDVLYSIIENKDIEIISVPGIKPQTEHHKYKRLRGTLEKIYALDDVENVANETRQRLSDWVKRSEKTIEVETGKKVDLWEEEIYLFPKWDGVSIIFEIDKKNHIEKALTRGNTSLNEADDVTFIFKALESEIVCKEMKGKPYGLKTEVVMQEELLEDYNSAHKTDYKSSRSIVSSIINSDKLDGREQLLYVVKLRKSVIKNGEEGIEELCEEVYDSPFIRCKLKDIDQIKWFANKVRYVSGFRCDGVVIHIINKDIQEILGRKKDKNLFEVAYKYGEEVNYTKIEDIIFQVGKFGNISPVAILKPVKAKGNTIQRVSLGSFQRFKELSLAKGDTVKILYEIVPYLIFDENDPKCKRSKNKPIKPPKVCPECGHKLLYNDDSIPSCENPDCDHLKKSKIVNYLEKMNINGISYETISCFYDNKIIHSIKDLYKIKAKDIEKLDGFGEKSAEKIINEITSHKKVIDAVLLSALGIKGAGIGVFKNLCKEYTIDELMDYADEEFIMPLVQVKGIQEAKATIVINGLRKNRSLLLFLLDHLDIITSKGSNLYQKRFIACFTKIRSDEITKLIEEKKGVVQDNMTKDVDFLIVPNQSTESASVEKAKKYGIPIIPIYEVEDYIRKNYR